MNDLNSLINEIVGSQGYKRDITELEGNGSFIHNFNLRPSEVVNHLDAWVIGQKKAKWTLATKICSHLNGIRHELEIGIDPMDNDERVKSNVLLIGPTGSGKTYTIRKTAKKFGVPFVKVDATKFSETGYVGRSVDEIIRDLFKAALNIIKKHPDYKKLDEDEQEIKAIELAQYGIVFIDEFDKIAERKGFSGGDVSRTGVQRGLLTITEETDVPVRDMQNPMEAMGAAMAAQMGKKIENRMINTRNIIFIFSGVFAGLKDIINKRQDNKLIGFGADVKIKSEEDDKIWNDLKAEDLIDFGMEGELVGRIPVRVVLDRLSEDDLFHILKNPRSSTIMTLKNSMAGYGINVEFSDEVLRYAAKLAYEQNTGARGLVSAFDSIFQSFEAYLPDIPVSSILVTKAMIDVDNKEEFFEALTKQMEEVDLLSEKDHLVRYQKEVLSNLNVYLDISQSAVSAVEKQAKEENKTPYEKFSELLHSAKDIIEYYEKRGVYRYYIDESDLDDIAEALITQLISQKDSLKYVKEERVWSYKELIFNKYNAGLKFSVEAVGVIVEKAVREMLTPFEACIEIFKSIEPGFNSFRGKEVWITQNDLNDLEKFMADKLRG